MPEPKATHDFADLPAALNFLKRVRWELRSLRLARVYRDRLDVVDINGDYFELRGVGYPDDAIVELLRAVNGAFDPSTIHQPPPGDCREVATGRRYTWAQDRVM